MVDDGVQTTYYFDSDSDNYGDANVSTGACTAPVGYVGDNTDCDDTDFAIKPSATEITGDGIDQNCDDQEVCYVNADGDGYRLNTTILSTANVNCNDAGEALSSVATLDCNDGDASVYP